MVTNQQESQCILWYHEHGTLKKVQIQFKEKYGRNTKAPDVKKKQKLEQEIQREWTMPSKKQENIEENPKQSIRRFANCFGIS